MAAVKGAGSAAAAAAPPPPPPPHASLSPLTHALIGAACGVAEVTLLHPLVSLKNALQEGRALNLAPRALYRGYAANASSFAPITMLQFGANRALERRLSASGDGHDLSALQHVAVAAAAGAASSALSTPCELVIIQQQRTCGALLPTLAGLLRAHGPSVLLAGWLPCVLREALYTGAYLGVAPLATAALAASVPALRGGGGGGDDGGGAAQVLGAASSGVAAAVLTQPLDTVKTRMQGDGVAGDPRYSRGTAAALRSVVAQGGVRALWAGLLPRGARIVGATVILSTTKRAAVGALEAQPS